jgi:hypothetical protein
MQKQLRNIFLDEDNLKYEAQIRDTIPVRYDTDTVIQENFQNYRYDTAAIHYLKIKLNITKIGNDNKLIFKLFKMSKQVIITYFKLNTRQKRHN